MESKSNKIVGAAGPGVGDTKKNQNSKMSLNVNDFGRKSDKLGFTVKSEVTSGKGKTCPFI